MGAEKHSANENEIQSEGRKDNAAQPLNAAEDNAGAERYPAVRQDDSVEVPGHTETAGNERRTFEGVESAEPGRRGGEADPSLNQSQGESPDPGEGKR